MNQEELKEQPNYQNRPGELPQYDFSKSEDEGFSPSNINISDTARDLQQAALTSGVQRGTVLISQKPEHSFQHNVQSDLMDYQYTQNTQNTFNQINGNGAIQGGSSAVSSVSNTVYGTLYQDPASNRLQSQYYGNANYTQQNPQFNQAAQNSQGRGVSNQNHYHQQQSRLQFGAFSSQMRGSVPVGGLNMTANYFSNARGADYTRSSIDRDQQRNEHMLLETSGFGIGANTALEKHSHNKKSYQILKKPTTSQNNRANGQVLNGGRPIKSPIAIEGLGSNQRMGSTQYQFMAGDSQPKFNGFGSQYGFNKDPYNSLKHDKRPQTMGTIGGSQKPNKNYQLSDDNRSTLASEGLQDPRRILKSRKQKLQSAFYGTLKHGQIDPQNTTHGQLNSSQSLPFNPQSQIFQQQSFNDQFISNQEFSLPPAYKPTQSNPQGIYPELNLYNQQVSQLKLSSGLSMKQNNLKYHLMRQLLQKKNLDEIMVLQAKMLQQQREQGLPTPKGQIRLIRFPGMRQDRNSATPNTKEKNRSQSSSSSESSMSDDAEPFVDHSREQTQIEQGTRQNLNGSHVSQAHSAGTQPKDTPNYMQARIEGGVGGHQSKFSASGGIISAKMPTNSHSAMGQMDPDSSLNNLGVLNNHININIVKGHHSKKNSTQITSATHKYSDQAQRNTQSDASKMQMTSDGAQSRLKPLSKLEKQLKNDKMTQEINLIPEQTSLKRRAKTGKRKKQRLNQQGFKISQYNYCGVPSQSMVDEKNKQVQDQKDKIDFQRNLQLNKGCSVFNARSRKADVNLGISLSAAEQYESSLKRHQQNQQLGNYENLDSFSLDQGMNSSNIMRNQNILLRSSNQQDFTRMNQSYNQKHQRAHSGLLNASLQDSESLNFALGSLENKKLEQDVKLTNFMSQHLSYQKLVEKQEVEKKLLKEKRVSEVLQATKLAKIRESVPEKLMKQYAQLKKLYPKYDSQQDISLLSEKVKLSYVDKTQKKIRRDLKQETKVKQQEYEQMPNQEPVYVPSRQSVRQTIRSASSAGRRSQQSAGAVRTASNQSGARAKILQGLLMKKNQSSEGEGAASLKLSKQNTGAITHKTGSFQQEPLLIDDHESTMTRGERLNKVYEQFDGDFFKSWGTVNSGYQQLMSANQFGDFSKVTQREESIIQQLLYFKFPSLLENQVQLKVAKFYKAKKDLPSQGVKSGMYQMTNEIDSSQIEIPEFNCLFIGRKCPLSVCCKVFMTVNLNLECGAGKFLCSEKLCQFNPQKQFLLPIDFVTGFYQTSQNELMNPLNEKSHSYDQQIINIVSSKGGEPGYHHHSLNEDISQLNLHQREEFFKIMMNKERDEQTKKILEINGDDQAELSLEQHDQLTQLYKDLFMHQDQPLQDYEGQTPPYAGNQQLVMEAGGFNREAKVTSAKSGRSKKGANNLSKRHELINQELTKNVADGSFKHRSLRNVVSRGGARDQSQRDKKNGGGGRNRGNQTRGGSDEGRVGIASGNNKRRLDMLDDNTTENDDEYIEINSEMLEKEDQSPEM